MKRVLVLAIFLGIAVDAGLSQIPHTMSYQGILTDASGTPVPDGPVVLTFRFFDVASGGTALWQETQQVTILKGLFSVVLGSVTPISLPFDKPYWLGMSVAQGTELSPRTPLAASPYSMNSKSTLIEPAQGQGLSIRDTQGIATHVFYSNGEALHTAKTTIRIPSSTLADTALVIASGNGPAVFAVRGDTVPAGSSLSKTFRIQQEEVPYVIGGVSETSIGVVGQSVTATGVAGFSTSNNGVQGISQTFTGVDGSSQSGMGVSGTSVTSVGVSGKSPSYIGVNGSSTSGNGVQGVSETGIGIAGVSTSGPGVQGRGSPAGLFDGEVRITTVNQDPTQERILVWSNDQMVKYRTLPPTESFDGILVGKALVVKNSSGVEVFRVDTTGASLHKGDETFEGDVILKGTNGKGAKLVDAQGQTLAGFGRVDLDTDQRIGVYGKATTAGDLAGAFEGDVEVNGEVYVSSLHVVRGEGDTVVHFNADGTSEHKGLETYRAGLHQTSYSVFS